MFFTMTEDKRIRKRVRFQDIQSDAYVELSPEEMERVNPTTVLFMEGNSDSIYPDYFETPVHLVSDRLKQIIEMYSQECQFKCVVLNHLEADKQAIYWLVGVPERECLDALTEFYPNGWEKRVVLDAEKLKGDFIVRIKGIFSKKLVVQAELAESVMRRNLTGVIFQEVETSGEGC